MQKTYIERLKTKSIALKTFDMFNCAFLQHQKFGMQVLVKETSYHVDKNSKVQIKRLDLYIISKTFDFKVVKRLSYQYKSSNSFAIAKFFEQKKPVEYIVAPPLICDLIKTLFRNFFLTEL